MTERRALDRRQQDAPIALERRHGERRTYQAGCSCLPCRAANAAYEAAYRQKKAKGEPLAGSLVRAAETQRQLRLLVTECHTKVKTIEGEDVAFGGVTVLAQRLGLRDRHLQFHRRHVRRETAEKIGRMYQMDILEAPYREDAPLV